MAISTATKQQITTSKTLVVECTGPADNGKYSVCLRLAEKGPVLLHTGNVFASAELAARHMNRMVSEIRAEPGEDK